MRLAGRGTPRRSGRKLSVSAAADRNPALRLVLPVRRLPESGRSAPAAMREIPRGSQNGRSQAGKCRSFGIAGPAVADLSVSIRSATPGPTAVSTMGKSGQIWMRKPDPGMPPEQPCNRQSHPRNQAPEIHGIDRDRWACGIPACPVPRMRPARLRTSVPRTGIRRAGRPAAACAGREVPDVPERTRRDRRESGPLRRVLGSVRTPGDLTRQRLPVGRAEEPFPEPQDMPHPKPTR